MSVLSGWFVNPIARAACAYARQQVGAPYLFGGTGVGGFDCSGLVQAAYAHAGVTIPRDTFEQYAAPWIDVDKTKPGTWKQGDLIFVDTGVGAQPAHVQMVVNGRQGLIVEAPHTGAFVQVCDLWESTGQIMAVRRVVR